VQLGNQFGAVAARHLDVAEHDVERFACKDLGRLRPVFSADRGLHAQMPQQSLGRDALERMVFDDKNAQPGVADRHGGGGRRRAAWSAIRSGVAAW